MNDTSKLKILETTLKKHQADYTFIKDDKTLTSAAEGAAHYGVTPGEVTPTLLLKTPDAFIAAIICGDSRISLKKLKQALNLKDASLASPETVLAITGSKIGDMGMINGHIKTIIDARVLKNAYCYGGSGVPRITVHIKTDDLIKITAAEIFDFTDLRC